MLPGDGGNLRPAGQPFPQPAVMPRARRGDGFARLPLDQLILPLLDPPRPILIGLVAPPGGGKTMALRYLRGVLSAQPHVRLFDEDQLNEAREAAQSGPVILACPPAPTSIAAETFELCAWTLDDCMVYLASQHRPQVASVLDRLGKDTSLDALKGSPDLLCYVMDQMAANASLVTARQTIHEFLAACPAAAAAGRIRRPLLPSARDRRRGPSFDDRAAAQAGVAPLVSTRGGAAHLPRAVHRRSARPAGAAGVPPQHEVSLPSTRHFTRCRRASRCDRHAGAVHRDRPEARSRRDGGDHLASRESLDGVRPGQRR